MPDGVVCLIMQTKEVVIASITMFIGFIVFSYPQDEKVIRRNENVPQGCKAEMTSAAVTAAPATGAATAATTGHFVRS